MRKLYVIPASGEFPEIHYEQIAFGTDHCAHMSAWCFDAAAKARARRAFFAQLDWHDRGRMYCHLATSLFHEDG